MAAETDLPFHIVFNASSGSGDAQQARREMEEILQSHGRRFEFHLIENAAGIEAVTKAAAEAAQRDGGAVVAAGGDGTINATVQAALPTARPFGIVPQGTFNYSSRAHGIPLNTADATKALLDARIKPVQVGVINGRVFLVNASVGLYPQLLQDREAYKKQYGRKRAVAMWAGLSTLLRGHRQLLLEIEHDDRRELVRTPTLFVGNNPLQLEQIGLPEAEAVTQRRLAGIVVKPVSTAQLIWLAVRGMLGQLGEDDRVRNFSFARMNVELVGRGNAPVKVATDGEICWMRPPLKFSVATRPLQLLVPLHPVEPA